MVESIRANFPNNPNLISRRVALEETARILTENLFEDVTPAQILAAKEAADGTRDFLVSWSDGSEPSWVGQRYVADDVIQDYDEGLEYADAEEVLEEREGDGLREYLVRWSDGMEPSWCVGAVLDVVAACACAFLIYLSSFYLCGGVSGLETLTDACVGFMDCSLIAQGAAAQSVGGRAGPVGGQEARGGVCAAGGRGQWQGGARGAQRHDVAGVEA